MPSEVDPPGEGDGSIAGIELVDMFSRCYETFITPACNQYPNETLIRHEYLGCSPLYPTIAISLCTLAAFCQQHHMCPHFSIQAQVKSLCHLHEVPYWPSLTTALSVAYDAYLEILEHVDQELKKALQQDKPNWRLLNECPACFYKLQDEPVLDFEWLVAIDGNNSLKHWDSSTYGVMPHEDTRTACLDLWIPTSDVDKYANDLDLGDELSDDWVDEPDTGPSICYRL
ncbi:hypothetical protein J3R82DRAFT_5273 [Butyriboletus roseoflavus]|nr:hypothetical protein J3R82DRAFT_5273 [Butyriboletus roseoflavus]